MKNLLAIIKKKKKHHDPYGLLKNLWVELERRFSSAATITNAFLGQIHAHAAIRESENDRQPAKYPACLASHVSIFPVQYNRSQPSYHRRLAGNGGKEIAKFSEHNGDAYPGFHVFSEVVQKRAWKKNDPNINIGARLANPPIQTLSHTGQNKRRLKQTLTSAIQMHQQEKGTQNGAHSTTETDTA